MATLPKLLAVMLLLFGSGSNAEILHNEYNVKSIPSSPLSDIFKIIVLAGGDAEMLEGLLSSIASTDYSGDSVSLEIRIGGDNEREKTLSELVANAFVFPPSIVQSKILQTADFGRPGSIDSWINASFNLDSDTVILDVSMDLSPLWYRYAKAAWSQYRSRSDIAGISLTRQAITTSPKLPMKPMKITNGNEPFLFGMVVGPAAFSPHPERWREFIEWVSSMNLEDLAEKVPNLMAHLSPAKPFDELYFYHTRKAGGSSMKRLLIKTSKQHNMNFTHLEGIIVPSHYSAGFYRNRPQWVDLLYDENVLSITTLRDPVDRAISHYLFRGIWPVNDKVMSMETAVGIDAWMETYSSSEMWRTNSRLWDCASECFSRWFGGSLGGGYDTSHAKEVIESFDMVLPMDATSNPVFEMYLQRILGATNISSSHMNRTPDARKSIEITDEQKERLRNINLDDQRLVDNYIGSKDERSSFAVQDWWNMMDEDTKWTMWTQLFTYWCHLKGLSVLYVSPPDRYAMAVSKHVIMVDEALAVPREDELGQGSRQVFADFEPLPLSTSFQIDFPQYLKKYRLDGSLEQADVRESAYLS